MSIWPGAATRGPSAASSSRPSPPGSRRCAPATALAGGFGYASEQPPRWVVVCSRREPATDEEAAFLASACDTALVAAAQAGRVSEERTAARTGRALVELGQALSLEHGEERVLHLLTLAVARLVPQDGVSAWRADEGGFTLASAHGFPARRRPPLGAQRAVRRPAAGPDRVAAAARAPARRRPGARARAAWRASCRSASARATTPCSWSSATPLPDAAEEALLLGVADQALLALSNERLLSAQRDALSGIVACLGRALALRHRATAEHSDRLTSDCTAVGRALGVSGEELRDLAFAAALHDLGKIGVPERVLGNSGPLDTEGWRLIHAHPELGAQIIDPVGALSGAAALIRACHEHWDGTGYPLGLSGEEIPLGARIILACDAYHAMCEDRSYQAAMPPAAARERLRDLAGVDFDPRVVETLLTHLEQVDPAVVHA